MKKKFLVLMLTSIFSYITYAEGKQTIFFGYSQIILPDSPERTYYKISHNNLNKLVPYKQDHTQGINIQYSYQWDFPIGILTSFTSTSIHHDTAKSDAEDKENHHAFILGPIHQIHEYVSFWWGLGASNTDQYVTIKNNNSPKAKMKKQTDIKNVYQTNAFSYGAGIIFKLNPNYAFNISYYGSKINSTKNRSGILNGIQFSLGYKF